MKSLSKWAKQHRTSAITNSHYIRTSDSLVVTRKEKMNPLNPSIGKSIGYESGFSGKANTPEIAYLSQSFPHTVDKLIFIERYSIGFEEGESFREELILTIERNLGRLEDEYFKILEDFLLYCMERYWDSSSVFNSWEERLKNELSIQPAHGQVTKQIITNLLEEGRIQQAIQKSKQYAYCKKMKVEYFHLLLKDLTFKVNRDKRKGQEISLNEYIIVRDGIKIDLGHLKF